MAGSGAAGVQGDLRYRDKYFLRLINIVDREDEEGIKNSFELCQRDQQKVGVHNSCKNLIRMQSLCCTGDSEG